MMTAYRSSAAVIDRYRAQHAQTADTIGPSHCPVGGNPVGGLCRAERLAHCERCRISNAVGVAPDRHRHASRWRATNHLV